MVLIRFGLLFDVSGREQYLSYFIPLGQEESRGARKATKYGMVVYPNILEGNASIHYYEGLFCVLLGYGKKWSKEGGEHREEEIY